MLNKIKIGPKLIAGFLLVALIAAVIGIVGMVNMKAIANADTLLYEKMTVPLSLLSDVSTAFQRIRINSRDILRANDESEMNAFAKTINDLLSEIDDRMVEFNKLVISEEMKQLSTKYKSADEAYTHDLNDIIKLAMANQDSAGYKILDGSAKQSAMAGQAALDAMQTKETDDAKNSAALNTKTANSATVTMIITIIIGAVLSIILGLFLSRSISVPIGQTVALLTEIAAGKINRKLSMSREDEVGILAKSMDTMVDTLKDLIVDDGGVALQAASAKDLTKRLKKEYQGDFLKMKDNINTVIESLDTALQQVAQGTEQVSSASQQISAGSQSLAQGANEQASSLEEVSSSLEEMSSMTKQNAENANQAKNLATEANGNAAQGKQAMARMSEAINKIKDSSDQTAKIVKTIDEIAMQTNLLALNAAVEAARAGEAGRGFAVVAEEVRNLAQRSAEAAKNTANMIEESVKNAQEGVNIANDVAKSFEAIAGSNAKVDSLIAEIAAASQEQSQGIDQVNTAVAQMDKVTQQNAASSEESASAAEELSSQAEELQNMVAQFSLSNAGRKDVVGAVVHHAPLAVHQDKVSLEHKTDLRRKADNGRSSRNMKSLAHHSGKEINPKQAIPLEDDEVLKEF